MNINNIIYYISLIIIGIMFFNILKLSKRNNRSKKLINVVKTFNGKEVFFENIENFINTINDNEFLNKGRIVKVWGLIYYGRYDEVVEESKKINFNNLLSTNKKGYSIENNEDSIYYYLLASQNTLYSNNKIDIMKQLNNLFTIKEDINETLIYKIYESNQKYYFKEDDLGKNFFENVLEGNYSEYYYNKKLIGIYKSIVTIVLAKIYIDENEKEKFNDLKEDLYNYKETVIGNRFIEELNLNDYLKEEEK
ncbi:MAG: hypothetical protein GX675_05470 [Erysipelotrichaceae bacterium]|nr:hypothetical protein [Erysipelotrichaceae bacterium]